jgi:hypothetical protein
VSPKHCPSFEIEHLEANPILDEALKPKRVAAFDEEEQNTLRYPLTKRMPQFDHPFWLASQLSKAGFELRAK